MPPDFVERQFVGEPLGSPTLQRRMVGAMKDRGATWMRITYLPAKDQFVIEGWRVQPDDDGPEPV